MKNNILKKSVLILLINILLIFNCYEAFASNNNMRFNSMTIEDGLSQSTVQIIFQDSKGYIWMGTNDGLNRYNGYEMEIYKSDNEEKNIISDNYILNITEDKKGFLWVSTCYGLSKISVEDGRVKNYFSSLGSGNLPSNFVNCVLVTKDNTILVGTSSGVAVYNEENDTFEEILKEPGTLTSKNIKAMTQDIEGNIWIGTEDGLNKINLLERKIKHFNEEENRIINSDKIYSLLSDKNGYIWVGTENHGLNKIDVRTEASISYIQDDDNKNSIPSNTVNKMCQTRNGTIWIGTSLGLAKYDENKDSFVSYTNRNYDSTSLVNDYVYTVMEDTSGLIWVGTYAGVSIFDPKNKINHYKNDPFDSNSLSGNVVHGIYEDDDGYLWVGTRNNGVTIFNETRDKAFKLVTGSNDNNVTSNSIKVITGSGKDIWIGTNNGLNRINKESMVIDKYTVEDGLTGNNIKSLFYDSKGYLWIGSAEGLDILNVENGEIINLNSLLIENDVKDLYIEDIYEDLNGVYWIGSFLGGGLTKLDPHNKEIINYIDNAENENNFKARNSIRSITSDKYGKLWIGSSHGLKYFNVDMETFTTFTTKEGLPNNTIYGVIIDDLDSIWISTNNGISKLDTRKKMIVNLSSIDGLQSIEFNGKAYFKSKSGEMFFGGVNGFNSFYPEDIEVDNYSHKVVFDHFEIQGKVYNDINDMAINYGKHIIRIKYFLTSYMDKNNIQYQYKLQGLNNEWVTVNNNEVILNNLDPGNYTFIIRAKNKDGSLSEENKVTFTIKPPAWKGRNAIVAYVITIIFIIYLNVTKMKRLDNLVNKRTKQLMDEIEINNKLFNQVLKLERNKNNYFINLSHELRTPLNVITSVEQLITHLSKSKEGLSEEKLNYYMDVMKTNTKRLLNLINNIIDVSKFDHGSYKINLAKENIVYVVEEAALSLKDYVEAKGVELIIDTDVEEKIISCDASEIERCIVNLVSNAAKFTPEQGKIEVLMYDLGDKIKIEVSDTGVGIEEKYHKSIFDRFNQIIDSNSEEKGGSGLGLTITKHIIDMHNGEIYVASKKNEGSTFTIILPVE